MNDDDVQAQTAQLMRSYQELLLAGRFAEWIELWADDAVCEFPYAADPNRRRFEGRDAILAYMSATPGQIRVDEVVEHRSHPGKDPTTHVAELAIKGTAVTTGRPYNQRYVIVATATLDGLLSHYREYWNPEILAEALDQGAAFLSPAALAPPAATWQACSTAQAFVTSPICGSLAKVTGSTVTSAKGSSRRVARDRRMFKQTRAVIVVSQAGTLAMSGSGARLTRNQVSCTASSASAREPSMRTAMEVSLDRFCSNCSSGTLVGPIGLSLVVIATLTREDLRL